MARRQIHEGTTQNHIIIDSSSVDTNKSNVVNKPKPIREPEATSYATELLSQVIRDSQSEPRLIK